MYNKKIKILLSVLLICVLLCGCDIRNYIYTEDSLKRVAAKSLKEKYGEEFTIHRAWDKCQTMFFADCSPKDNPEIVFTADIEKNGDGVVNDGYTQAAVAKKIDDTLKDDFKAIYGDCYTWSCISNYYNVPQYKEPMNVTVEEYFTDAELDNSLYIVYVDCSEISDESIDKECDFFEKRIPDMIKQKDIPDLCILVYFTTGELVNKCRECYATRSELDYDLDNEVENYKNIGLSYVDGKLDKVCLGSWFEENYGDYREFREGINTKTMREDD